MTTVTRIHQTKKQSSKAYGFFHMPFGMPFFMNRIPLLYSLPDKGR